MKAGAVLVPQFAGWLVSTATPPDVRVGDIVVVLDISGCVVYVTVLALEGEQYRGEVFMGVGGGSAGVGRGDYVTFERQHVFRISSA